MRALIPNRDLTRVEPRVLAILETILDHEGKLANHKADKGGITNYGVSLRYARQRGLDLNGDGKVDGQDILLVTPDQARQLYLEDFFYQPRFDRLPIPIQPVMFDFSVHSGAPRAGIELQTCLNAIVRSAPDVFVGKARLKPDGVIGPKTQDLAFTAQVAMGGYFVNAVCDFRQAFLDEIVRSDPTQRAFENGWRRRVDSFRVTP